MDGLVIIDKPPRTTSARVVAAVKRTLGNQCKVGHAGTLDPFATGILIVLVGKSTRQCEQIMSWPKEYQATVKFGATTVTDDIDSPEQPVEAKPAGVPDYGEIEQALSRFVGNIEQRPPLYSAVKINGKRACDRARKGMQIELQPRIVHVESIKILGYAWPFLEVQIACGRGTYIRSIARDLGRELGTGGYLSALKRTRIGRFGLEDSIPLAGLTPERIAAHLKQVSPE